MKKYEAKHIIAVLMNAQRAGRQAGESKLKELQKAGPRWAVKDESDNKIVGTMLDVCGYTALHLTGRSKIVRAFKALGNPDRCILNVILRIRFTTPKQLRRFFRDVLKNECWIDQQKEHFWVMGLNVKNRVMYLELVSLGILNESVIHPREVFKSAIIKGIANLIFCHNHPSGESEPSQNDIDITRRLKEGGDLLGIKILDHIIISENNLYSFQTEGIL